MKKLNKNLSNLKKDGKDGVDINKLTTDDLIEAQMVLMEGIVQLTMVREELKKELRLSDKEMTSLLGDLESVSEMLELRLSESDGVLKS